MRHIRAAQSFPSPFPPPFFSPAARIYTLLFEPHFVIHNNSSTMDEKFEVKRTKNVPFLRAGYLLKVLACAIALVYCFNTFSTPFFGGNDNPELDPEQVILDSLKVNLASDWSKKYTSEPHLAGTNYGLVEWTEAKFKEFGFETTIDPYEILVSYPKDHDLKLLDSKGEVVYTAPLKEDVIDEDPTDRKSVV